MSWRASTSADSDPATRTALPHRHGGLPGDLGTDPLHLLRHLGQTRDGPADLARDRIASEPRVAAGLE